MKKLLYLTVVIAILAMTCGIAYAGFNWDGDPIFKVEKTTVKVLVWADQPLVPSNVWVDLGVPQGDVDARVASSHGFTCEVVDGGKADDEWITVEVTVTVQGGYVGNAGVIVRVPKYGKIPESQGTGQGTDGDSITVTVKIPRNKK